ncbi:MAG: Uma2 family endonuclease [Bryobacteraceae bacterium]
MAAQSWPRLVTYEEFVPLAETSNTHLELHFGQVVDMGLPTLRHVSLQKRIERLMEGALGSEWEVLVEMPYRALPQFESRSADVGAVSGQRFQAGLKENYLTGSPEIVVEVFSPKSNTAAEMAEKASLCLGTGTVQFWVVDERFSIVSVTTASGTNVFTAGQRIPLGITDASLAVDDIFA